ncbi:hypothetical protein Acr_05g0016200 [Actinidia rufa]|uniref:Uncharacterized protein n=1 Tax=Actinidia rufa TaxID=165716 RepID=A0A7J0ENC0_9ERIC|nr:hypothetical protein Acr_05g0016200 [Actinidia rufa]
MGSTDQSESQALVLEGSRERGRGQGRGHHRGTGKGRWRSQARGRTVRCFYYDQEGRIKRDCPKYKAQDQSSDTAATTVMAVDEDEIDVLPAASDDGKDVYGWRTTRLAELLAEGQSSSAWQTGDSKGCNFDANEGTLRVSKGNKEMLWGKKTGGLYRLEGSVQTDVRKASVRVPRGSGAVQELREMLWDMYGSLARHESCNQCRMSIEKLRGRRQIVRTREERWSHDNSQSDILWGTPWWGGGVGHLSEKVQALQCAGADTSVGKWSSPLMWLRYLRCCLVVLWGSWIRSCQEGQLEDIGLPSSWLEGEIVASSPSGRVQAHLDKSKSSSQVQVRLEFIWSVHVTGETLELSRTL